MVVYNVFLGEKDTGFTYTDFNKKQTIVGISYSTSFEEFFNTVVHEIKHVQSHICKYFDVREDSEDAAYLAGYIAERMIGKIMRLLSAGIL